MPGCVDGSVLSQLHALCLPLIFLQPSDSFPVIHCRRGHTIPSTQQPISRCRWKLCSAAADWRTAQGSSAAAQPVRKCLVRDGILHKGTCQQCGTGSAFVTNPSMAANPQSAFRGFLWAASHADRAIVYPQAVIVALQMLGKACRALFVAALVVSKQQTDCTA